MKEADNGAFFTDRPKACDLPEQWKILRAKKNGTPACLIVSNDCTGCYVHYWAGRTRPCKRENCTICDQGQMPRWRGYIAVLTPSPSRGRLLEITASVVGDVDRWIKENGTIRGATISLSRKGNVANGELACKIGRPAGFTVDLPTEPDIRGILGRVWKLTHAPTRAEYPLDQSAALYRSAASGLTAATNGHADRPHNGQ